MIDPASGELRKAWAFVMLLSWSRHQYVEFVWDQKVETFLNCHRKAFEFFRGVPQRVRIDNLKAAILKAVFDDPQVQYAYRECAEHYGFLIAPCRAAVPEYKGKVDQGGVHYVCRNFLGGRIPTALNQANREVLVWCNTTAGLRIHGTTQEKTLERFEQVEKTCLKHLPESPYEIAVWKNVKLYRDGYVTFEKAFYSVPCRLYPGRVWICGGGRQVRIFDAGYHLVATHVRAQKPGERQTQLGHLPPEKVPAFSEVRDTKESPFAPERGLSLYTFNRAYWENRFYDEAYWARYLDVLAQNRFNALVVIFGYENGGFLAPCYPYFFDVEGFPDVRMVGITPQQQQRNLASLNRLIQMAHDRGVKFTVGIWDHIYPGGVQGGGIPGADEAMKKATPGLVWGVTAENLVPYTKAALARFVKEVPTLDGIQCRRKEQTMKRVYGQWTGNE